MKKYIVCILVLTVCISCISKKKEVQQTVQANEQEAQITVKKEVKQEELKKPIKVLDTLPPKKISRTLEQYKKNVKVFSIEKFKENLLSAEEVVAVTPTTDKEFSFYYSLTYPDINKQQLHDMITAAIFDKAFEDNNALLFLYSNMAEFVDGEYAEGYMIYVENIIKNNKSKFCVIYKYLSKRSKWVLEDIYNEICKGIKRTEEDY